MVTDSNIHLSLPTDAEDDRMVFLQIIRAMDNHGIENAFVLNLPDLNPGIDQLDYVERLSFEPRFFPVPCFDSIELRPSVVLVGRLQKIGVKAIKLHPRQLGSRLSDPRVRDLISVAHSANMVVLLCTYPHVKRGLANGSSYLPEILETQIAEQAKVVLMHGGATQLLDTGEWARRQNGTVMIDLSWTMTELWDSSVRFDMASLCSRFGTKICVGSDFPYVSFDSFQQKLAQLEELSGVTNLRNLASQNLRDFLGMAS